MENSHSRGKKQRIRKKIQALKNPQDATTPPTEQKKPKETVKDGNAKERVESLLKKREEKMERKERAKQNMYTPEDREIMKQSKNKKR